MSSRIFISYSTKDTSIANKVVEYVEAHGYPCWIAPRNITPGKDYTDLLNDSLKGCSALILIVSDASIHSQWVKKELTTAVSYNKKIIPFKIQNVVLDGGLEFMLNNVQWIDASSNVSSHFPDIIEGLGVLPDTTTAIPTTTVDTHGGKKTKTVIAITASACAVALAGLLVLSTVDKPHESNTVIDTTLLIGNDKPPEEEIEANVTTTKDSGKKSETPTKKTEESAVNPKKKTTEVKAESQNVETPTVEVTSAKQEEAAIQTATSAETDNGYKRRRKAAIIAQNSGRYREAIVMYQKLFQENPDDKELLTKIEECRTALSRQGN